MVRRAPLGDDRQDLDALVPTGDAARRLVAPSVRVQSTATVRTLGRIDLSMYRPKCVEIVLESLSQDRLRLRARALEVWREVR